MVKKGELFDQLESLGFTNDTIVKPGASIDLPIIVALDGNNYLTVKTVTYTARKGKMGLAK
jgi:hypothetical protein